MGWLVDISVVGAGLGELAACGVGVFGCEVAGIAIAVGVLSGRAGPIAVQAPEKSRMRKESSLKGGGCIFMWIRAPCGRWFWLIAPLGKSS